MQEGLASDKQNEVRWSYLTPKARLGRAVWLPPGVCLGACTWENSEAPFKKYSFPEWDLITVKTFCTAKVKQSEKKTLRMGENDSK